MNKYRYPSIKPETVETGFFLLDALALLTRGALWILGAAAVFWLVVVPLVFAAGFVSGALGF